MTSKPIRTCIVCRKKGNKEEFIKIVKNKNGMFSLANGRQLDGRGAYVCNNSECVEKCLKTKALNRIFKTNVPLEFYEELKNGN